MWIKRAFYAAMICLLLPTNGSGQNVMGLTITGAIDQSPTILTRQALAQIDWVDIETYTSFTDGLQRFSGARLARVLAAVGAKGTTLRARALNGYFVTIPLSHAQEHNVLLAMDHDGKPMRIRDKGPIWVVYPLSEAEAKNKPFDNQMIWQLSTLEVLP
jgi:hypothetical protein